MTITETDWNEAGPGTPLNAWLETKCDGDESVVLAICRISCVGDEPEWINRDGATTVTCSTVLPPTHWRWPSGKSMTLHNIPNHHELAKALGREHAMQDRALAAEAELARRKAMMAIVMTMVTEVAAEPGDAGLALAKLIWPNARIVQRTRPSA